MGFMDKLKNALAPDWNEEETNFRLRHGSDEEFNRYRPVHQYGYSAGRDERYVSRKFDEVEGDLRTGWTADAEKQYGKWDDVRGYVRDAYTRGQERTLKLKEEQLAVGKRTVEKGEVGINKRVDTEHVTERVPLTREEVTIERRPVNEVRAASDADFSEETIRVPVREEEAVVEKRAVVKEEVGIKKHAVTDTKEIGADLKKERAEIVDTTRDTVRGKDSDIRDR